MSLNDQLNTELLHTETDLSGTTQSIAPISEVTLRQTPISTKDAQAQQTTPQMPDYIEKMICASFVCGIIIVIGTILTTISLATGFLTLNQGFSMASGLLIGVIYNVVREIGLVLCGIVVISAFVVKRKHHIRIGKQLVMTAVSILMIEFPYIMMYILPFASALVSGN